MAAPRRWRGAALWAAVVVVAGLALAVGAGAFSPGHGQPASLYQRTLEVAGQYRCPVCASESAAVSDAAEAVEIRSLIQGWLKKGDSQAQIRGYLVSDYGTSILEKPPASGLNTLVWALPAVAAALGIIGLGFGFPAGGGPTPRRWPQPTGRSWPIWPGPIWPGPILAEPIWSRPIWPGPIWERPIWAGPAFRRRHLSRIGCSTSATMSWRP
jgi:cytochrome c-type biogenesis protein CcmH